jgi:tetratricopeptide (TPR) repeat protein
MDRINASLADMKAAYAANPELCGAMLAVAEKCYTKELSQSYQNPDPQNVLLRLCRDTLENNIIGKTSNKGLEADACYIAGLSCERLGDYVKAAQMFRSAFELNPKHRYADYCLFAQADCYEKAKAIQADITITSDDIEEIYREVIAKYPKSEYAFKAALRLDELQNGTE